MENDDNDTSETIGANNTEIGKDFKCIINKKNTGNLQNRIKCISIDVLSR